MWYHFAGIRNSFVQSLRICDIFFCFCLLGPLDSLGMDSHKQHDINNNQLTGWYYSVSGAQYHPPWQARLGNNPSLTLNQERLFFASALQGPGLWVQVDLLTPHTLIGIAMSSGSSSCCYVKTVKVQHSLDSSAILDMIYDETGNEKVN